MRKGKHFEGWGRLPGSRAGGAHRGGVRGPPAHSASHPLSRGPHSADWCSCDVQVQPAEGRGKSWKPLCSVQGLVQGAGLLPLERNAPGYAVLSG